MVARPSEPTLTAANDSRALLRVAGIPLPSRMVLRDLWMVDETDWRSEEKSFKLLLKPAPFTSESALPNPFTASVNLSSAVVPFSKSSALWAKAIILSSGVFLFVSACFIFWPSAWNILPVKLPIKSYQ